MATFENVEKLRERANVSYEEAKAALEASGDDLLDAMIYLETQGKVAPPAGGGSYRAGTAQAQSETPVHTGRQGPQRDGERFSQMMGRFFKFCGRLLEKGNHNHFEVWRHGEYSFSFPVTVLVLLLLFAFPVMIPLAIVGLFFGYRYRFSGRDLEGTAVNKAMDSAANAAESFKEEIKTSHEEHRQTAAQAPQEEQPEEK